MPFLNSSTPSSPLATVYASYLALQWTVCVNADIELYWIQLNMCKELASSSARSAGNVGS